MNVVVKDVQCDDIWSFVNKKEERLWTHDDPNFGGAYTSVAIERDTRLALDFTIGKRRRFKNY